MSTRMVFRPLSSSIGVEVLGASLADDLTDVQFAAIRRALADNSILLIREQQITPEQQIRFSRRFGPLELHVLKDFCLPEHPAVFVVSNVKVNGKYIGANNAGEQWHTDLCYLKNPSLGSVFRAIEVPEEGGETRFAGMYAAYEALPKSMKRRIDGLRAVHSYSFYYGQKTNRPPLTEEQKRQTPDVTHPVVRTNCENGRKALYVSEALCPTIEGMPADEGRALIVELTRHATREEFVYSHTYQVGDVIVWDNRSSMHRAIPYNDIKYRRVMHRTTIEGDGPPV